MKEEYNELIRQYMEYCNTSSARKLFTKPILMGSIQYFTSRGYTVCLGRYNILYISFTNSKGEHLDI